MDQLIRSQLPPDHLQRLRIAGFDAITAERATAAVDPLGAGENGPLRAGALAVAGVDALLQEKAELWRALQGLWILAPLASQRASLEEDHRPDPGSVMHGISLDVEYHCLLQTGPSLRTGSGLTTPHLLAPVVA